MKLSTEGRVAVEGGSVWYGIAGGGSEMPLLVLHGGPGYPHDYLVTLEGLGVKRPVVFYDQLGCGRSDRPTDRSLWRVERFVRELAQVREALGLARVHLLGHSWGTMLAVEALLHGAAGVECLILASPALSIPRWLEDADRLRRQLPPSVQVVLEAHETAGTTASAEYEAAAQEFYRRHLCRLDPFPECMNVAHDASGGDVYQTMWGPSEFYATGLLKDWERSSRLAEIRRPVLITCGRFDEATPETSAWYASLLPDARLEVFENSAHMPHLEEPDRYLAVVKNFLARAGGNHKPAARLRTRKGGSR